MRVLLSLAVFLLPGVVTGQDFLTGCQLQQRTYQGPGQWRQTAEPIWVYEYHILRLRYRAWGLAKSETPLLTLDCRVVRPPVYAARNQLVVVTAQDLVADGQEHTLEIDLQDRILAAQIDELTFALPAGARLEVCALEFCADASPISRPSDAPPLPEGTQTLAIRGPLEYGGFPATSLRGREAIRIEGDGKNGRTLYLSMSAHLAGLSSFAAGHPIDDAWRIRRSCETADMIARITYADGSEEEQFPLWLPDRDHALVNRTPGLYALTLEDRPLRSVDLLDRSPHLQLVLSAAGLSPVATPEPADEPGLPAPPDEGRPARAMDLEGSPWFELAPLAGKPPLDEGLRPDFQVRREGETRVLSLAVTNTRAEPAEFTVVFPAIETRSAAEASDVYYLYPCEGAVISNADREFRETLGTRFPLQFLDVFSPGANQGACVIVRDTEGQFKTFGLHKQGTSVTLEVRYPVRLAPGATYRAPEAAVVPHGGDWRQGFAAYRQWLSTWYQPAGSRPAWLRCAFWSRRDYPLGGTGFLFDVRENRYTFDRLIRDGESFGGIDFIDISGWAQSDALGRVGDYPIELGGVADLRRNIALAAASHIATGLYFEGYLVDKHSAIGRRAGEAWQMVDAAGQRMQYRVGDRERYTCPLVPAWRQYLAGRMAAVAADVGAPAVYLDSYGVASRRCFAPSHGHVPGAGVLPGEIQMMRDVRAALDRTGLRETMIYIEYNPADAAAPFCDAAFCYALRAANRQLSPARLNLWRFAFPDVRLWDMCSAQVDPRPVSAELCRLSLWHGNGLYLKGHADTWFGEDLLSFLRRAHGLLKAHAPAFSGRADPLVASPHPAVFINRFQADQETVYTLFNTSFRTVRFAFQGSQRTLGPRDVDVVAEGR